jgi:hypothetical protein
VLYECPDPLRLLVHSCTGNDPSATCDLEGFNIKQQTRRAPAPRATLTALLAICHVQTPGEAKADASGAPAGGQPRANGVAEANGIKVGDQIEVVTGFGWTSAKVLAISGNSYRVLTNGVQVTKDYPSEVRRLGGLTASDHAAGQYTLGDRVVAHVGSGWVEGKVISMMGQEYQVELPGNRAAWVGPESLRPGKAVEAVAPKTGVPPAPGMVSCAGKIEGRYAATTSNFGAFQIRFKSGTATVIDAMSNDDVFECWTGGGKVLLHKPSDPNMDVPIDINDDGTLQTPFGEIKRKGN